MLKLRYTVFSEILRYTILSLKVNDSCLVMFTGRQDKILLKVLCVCVSETYKHANHDVLLILKTEPALTFSAEYGFKSFIYISYHILLLFFFH